MATLEARLPSVNVAGLRAERPAPPQELSLHGNNIEKIELLAQACRHLRILYLQNNVIWRIGARSAQRPAASSGLRLRGAQRTCTS